jgi:hypothetical protein
VTTAIRTTLNVALALGLLAACGTNTIDSGGDDDGFDGDGNDECTQTDPIEIGTAAPPDVLLVVDKSGSMDQDLDSGEQKWGAMKSALTTVVGDYDSSINFGLMLYPMDDNCGVGSVRSQIKVDNGPSINASLSTVTPDGGTPTHTTMAAALTYFNGQPKGAGARYALLATDGEPNCGPGDDEEPTVDESVAAIARLKSAGIGTFVLGFGGSVNTYPDTLQAMAAAGGTGDYFAANSPAELGDALDEIAELVGKPSCTFALDREPGELDEVHVYQDSDSVARSSTSGWDYDEAGNSITFYGGSCEDIRGGSTEKVRIEFDCDGDSCNDPDGCDVGGGEDDDGDDPGDID